MLLSFDLDFDSPATTIAIICVNCTINYSLTTLCKITGLGAGLEIDHGVLSIRFI